MADIDLKAATPDTSVPGGAFVFGADSQSAAAPSAYPVSRISEVAFSFDASNQEGSLAHMTGWSVGDVVRVKHFDASRQDGSSMLWRCWQVGSGTVGAISNGGVNNGIQMQGNGVRWLAVPGEGNIIDIRAFGVVCDGTTTGQETRVEVLRAAAQARGLTLTGAGVLRISRTLDLRFCAVDFSNLVIQAGTLVDSTTAPTNGDFYTAAGTNIEVASITRANPGVVETTSAHGLAADTMILFGVSGLGSLPHELTTLTPYYVRNPTSTTFEVSATSGGASIDTTATSVEINLEGTAYVYVPPADVPGFETVDLIQWNGQIRRYAYAVLAAGDGAVNGSIRQDIRVRGDGNFDYTTRATVAGVKGEGDDSPLGAARYQATYCGIVATFTGAYEKKAVHVAGTYVELGVWMPKDTSADTIDLYLQLTKYRAGYWEYDGISSSINVKALWESRDDPGDDRPSHWSRSGKNSTLSGVSRAHNGLRLSLIDKPKQFGADAFSYLGFITIDTYGNVIDVRRCRRIGGDFKVYDAKQGPGSGGSDTAPAVRISRVIDAGELRGSLHDITTTYGLEVGDGTLYSRDAALGSYSIQMGNNVNVADTNIDSNGFPTTLDAVRIRSVKGGHVNLDACHGNIVVGSGVQAEGGRPFRLVIPRHQYRYTRTIDPAAVIEIGAPALLDSSGKVALTQLPQNVIDGSGINVTFNPLTGQSTIALDVDGPGASWSESVLGTDFTNDTTTQTAVTALKFTPAANKRYIVEGWIAHTANANGTGVRVGITMPSGLVHAPVQIVSANGGAASQSNNNAAASGNTASTAANSAGAVACMTFIRAIVIAGASPGGDVQVTVASELASNLVTVLAGSVLRWRDIG